MNATSVGIVGAGVIRLTSAYECVRRGYQVSIYTDREPLATTSMRAAASFKPHEIDHNPLTVQLVQDTWSGYAEFLRLHADQDTGVKMHTHYEAFSAPRAPAWYLAIIGPFDALTFPAVPGGYQHGWKYRTYFIDTSVFMPYLVAWLERAGVHFIVRQTPRTREDIPALGHSKVVLAVGMGGRELCADPDLHGMRGQIALVDPRPDMDWSISADGFYVYPRARDTVLGGTTEHANENESVDQGAIHLIVRGNKRILPDVDISQVRRSYAGIRPWRKGGVRLERFSLGTTDVVTNYGHGGSGFTLCFGSAKKAADLLNL